MARLNPFGTNYNKAEKKSGYRKGMNTSSDKKSKGKIPKNKAGFKVRKK